MVKEQNIALNPSKISGICGRLMCCMSFEHKVYREMWTGLPGPGSKIKTPNGNYIVLSLDIARNAVRCHKPSGGDIVVPKDLFADFRQAVMNGEEWEVPEEVQAEIDSTRKPCSTCRTRGTIKSIVGALNFPQKEKAPESSVEEKIEPHEEKQDEIGDQEKKIIHKRSGRRRGRRGGRKIATDGAEAAPQEQNAPHHIDRIRSTEPVKRPQQERSNGPETPETNVVAGGDAVKRSRRRRRRPKRPTGEGGQE
jgi:hypothetical protein